MAAEDDRRARDLSYRYLALRPRSRAEISAYLIKKEFQEDVIARTIELLEGYGYIDDAKFAGSWAAHLVNTKGISRRAVFYELKRKGVSEYLAEEAVEKLGADEDAEDDEAVALRVAWKKAESLRGLEPEKARRRLVSHLQRRGFSYGVINSVLKKLG